MDLEEHCPNERTRADRLRRLNVKGFVERLLLEVGGRVFIHYRLTRKGRRALRLLRELRSLVDAEAGGAGGDVSL